MISKDMTRLSLQMARKKLGDLDKLMTTPGHDILSLFPGTPQPTHGALPKGARNKDRDGAGSGMYGSLS